jgi:hypothetical protein
MSDTPAPQLDPKDQEALQLVDAFIGDATIPGLTVKQSINILNAWKHLVSKLVPK